MAHISLLAESAVNSTISLTQQWSQSHRWSNAAINRFPPNTIFGYDAGSRPFSLLGFNRLTSRATMQCMSWLRTVIKSFKRHITNDISVSSLYVTVPLLYRSRSIMREKNSRWLIRLSWKVTGCSHAFADYIHCFERSCVDVTLLSVFTLSLSRWCIVSRRLKILSNFFLGSVAPSF